MWRTLTSKGINRMKTWDSKRGKKGARRGNRIRKPLLLLLLPHTTLCQLYSCYCKLLCPLGKHFSLWIETETWFKKKKEKVWNSLLFFSTFWRLWKLVSWDNCSLHASFPRSKVFRDLKLKFYLLNLTPWAKVDLKTKLICLAKIPGIVILFKNSS